MPSPSAKNVVWPVARNQVRVGWDADAPYNGSIAWAPAQTIHLPYEPLSTVSIKVDSEGVRYPDPPDVQGRLAVGWEPSEDFRVWTIRLRQGVKSHAGNELTAEDVKWSWDRAFALRGLGIWRSKRVAGIPAPDAIEIVDRYSVRFSLSGPNPEFPQFLIFSTNMVIDSTEAKRHSDVTDPWSIGWLAKNVAGFGAFKLDSHTADTIELSARDEFWAGRPGIDTVTQIGVPRRDRGLRLLEKGEANLLLNVFPHELARFAGKPEYSITMVRGNHSALDLEWRQPPFDDANVRQAVAYALPYDPIFSDVYGGHARPCRSAVSPASKFYTGEFWPYRTDYAKARELLAKSGHPDGIETQLWVGPSEEATRFGEIVSASLKEAGINVEVLSGLVTRGAPMRFRDECGHALTEAMYDIAHDYDPPAGMRAGMTDQDRVWSNRLRAIRAAEAKDQPGMYRDLQRDLVDFCGIIPIAEIQTGWVVRGDLDPWALSPLSLGVNTTVWGGHRWDLGA